MSAYGYAQLAFSGQVDGEVRMSTTLGGVAVANFRVRFVRLNRAKEEHLECLRLAAFADHAATADGLLDGDTVHGTAKQRTTQAGLEWVVDHLERP
jgi:hypothetical protein